MEARRKAFIRKWRLKRRAVTDSLEEAGDRLFAFTRTSLDEETEAFGQLYRDRGDDEYIFDEMK